MLSLNVTRIEPLQIFEDGELVWGIEDDVFGTPVSEPKIARV